MYLGWYIPLALLLSLSCTVQWNLVSVIKDDYKYLLLEVSLIVVLTVLYMK